MPDASGVLFNGHVVRSVATLARYVHEATAGMLASQSDYRPLLLMYIRIECL